MTVERIFMTNNTDSELRRPGIEPGSPDAPATSRHISFQFLSLLYGHNDVLKKSGSMSDLLLKYF
jgi:hypothetical protein